MAGLNRASSSGSSSARTRLRGMRDVGVGFVLDERERRARPSQARSSPRRQSSSGRTMRPLRGCIAARPRGPAPRSRPQQQGFGLVVARVAERRRRRRRECCRARSKNAWRAVRAASSMRSLLARARARPRPRGRRTRHAERRGELAHELLVAVRRGAQLVIEMDERRRARASPARVEPAEHVRERRRIRAARHRRERRACRGRISSC